MRGWREWKRAAATTSAICHPPNAHGTVEGNDGGTDFGKEEEERALDAVDTLLTPSPTTDCADCTHADIDTLVYRAGLPANCIYTAPPLSASPHDTANAMPCDE